jgi:hypothetical protein
MIPGSQALLINVFGLQQSQYRADDLVHHHLGGADRGALARRLHLGQLRVAVDLSSSMCRWASSALGVLEPT